MATKAAEVSIDGDWAETPMSASEQAEYSAIALNASALRVLFHVYALEKAARAAVRYCLGVLAKAQPEGLPLASRFVQLRAATPALQEAVDQLMAAWTDPFAASAVFLERLCRARGSAGDVQRALLLAVHIRPGKPVKQQHKVADEDKKVVIGYSSLAVAMTCHAEAALHLYQNLCDSLEPKRNAHFIYRHATLHHSLCSHCTPEGPAAACLVGLRDLCGQVLSRSFDKEHKHEERAPQEQKEPSTPPVQDQ